MRAKFLVAMLFGFGFLSHSELPLSASPCLLGLGSASPQSPDEDEEAGLVVKVYDVSDLLTQPQAFEILPDRWPGTGLRSKVTDAQPGVFGGGGMGGGGMFAVSPSMGTQGMGMGVGGMGGGGMGDGFVTGYAGAQLPANQIGQVIVSMVEPKSWENQGGICICRALGGSLLIRHAAEVHKEIEALLGVLRSAQAKQRTVAVQWVALKLNVANAESLLTGKSQPEIDEIILQSAVQAGSGTGLNGQEVACTSGEHRNIVIGVTPVVGSGGGIQDLDKQNQVGYQSKTVKPVVGWSAEFLPFIPPGDSPIGTIQVGVSCVDGGPPALVIPVVSWAGQVDRGNLKAFQVVGTVKSVADQWTLLGGMSEPGDKVSETYYILVKWN